MPENFKAPILLKLMGYATGEVLFKPEEMRADEENKLVLNL